MQKRDRERQREYKRERERKIRVPTRISTQFPSQGYCTEEHFSCGAVWHKPHFRRHHSTCKITKKWYKWIHVVEMRTDISGQARPAARTYTPKHSPTYLSVLGLTRNYNIYVAQPEIQQELGQPHSYEGTCIIRPYKKHTKHGMSRTKITNLALAYTPTQETRWSTTFRVHGNTRTCAVIKTDTHWDSRARNQKCVRWHARPAAFRKDALTIPWKTFQLSCWCDLETGWRHNKYSWSVQTAHITLCLWHITQIVGR